MRLELINQSVRRNIVHDLKTPVTVIQGCTDVLLSQEEDDPELRHEMLSIINEQTHRLSEELQEILAPPVDQNWMPRYEEFDLRLVVDKAIMAEKQTERARGHRFELHGDKGPLLVTADRRKVRRVVENLLSNAIKYSPGEEKTVHVTVEARDGSAVLGVRDEGIGMTHEQLAHVLAAPGRVVAPDLDIEGSGFGLDSCRQILAAHGGTLGAESEPGEGSTFVITLPIAPPDDLRKR
jgi:signal transduction histidine kinase